MPEFRATASGAFTTTVVPESGVARLVEARDRFGVFLALTCFFAGAAIAGAVTLGGELKHPTVIYLVLAVTGPLAFVFGLLAAIENKKASGLRSSLKSQNRLNFTFDMDDVMTGPVAPPRTGHDRRDDS